MRTGIFGGAFDPFHSEHRKLIESAKKELNLDRIIITVSYAPPHKDTFISDYYARRAMVEVGVADLDYVVIDDIERERGIVNPAYETIPLVKKKYSSDKYYYIIGGDSMVNFHTWIHPEIIANTIDIAVVLREGFVNAKEAAERASKAYGADITVLQAEGEEVSSSVIKASVETYTVPQNVTPQVLQVIEEYHLYHRYEKIVDRLKAELPERTFNHCVRTALFAVKYATRLHLNYDKVLLSGLLHDCAKHINIVMDGVPKAVTHQYEGAVRAKEEYGITDEQILDAIRYHTSGKPDMSALGKLIYCADMLESGREYPGVDKLRAEYEKDPNEGFVKCINASMDNLLTKDASYIYPLTKECVEYYNNNTKEITNDTERN